MDINGEFAKACVSNYLEKNCELWNAFNWMLKIDYNISIFDEASIFRAEYMTSAADDFKVSTHKNSRLQ